MQWSLVNINTVKVKCVLNLNHSENPRQHYYANNDNMNTFLWSPGIHNEVSLYVGKMKM